MPLRLQPIQLEPGQSFYFGRFANPDFNFPYRFHPEIEVGAIENGFCTYVVGGTPLKVNKDDIFIIGKNIPHFVYNASTDSQGPDWARITLLLFRPRQTLGDHLLGSPELAPLRTFLERVNRSGIVVQGKTRDKMWGLLRKQREARGIDRMIGLLTILRTLAEAPVAELPLIGDGKSEFGSLHYQDVDRLARVFDYVNQHYMDGIRLENVAKIAHMAPASFSRFFHRVTNQTFQHYLIDFRINECAARLIQTEDTIIEIGYACGFNNLSNFNRQFKAQKGMAPTEFRARWRGVKLS